MSADEKHMDSRGGQGTSARETDKTHADRTNYAELVKHMMHQGGMTYVGLSRALGKSDGYMAGMLTQMRSGSAPNSTLLSDIARACGYELLITGHGEDLPV